VQQGGLMFYQIEAKLLEQNLNMIQLKRLEEEVKKGMREAQNKFGQHSVNTLQNVSKEERASGFQSSVTSLLPA
jgi:uncharacterized phage-associated protein